MTLFKGKLNSVIEMEKQEPLRCNSFTVFSNKWKFFLFKFFACTCYPLANRFDLAMCPAKLSHPLSTVHTVLSFYCIVLGWVLAPFWSENGYTLSPFWSGIGYGFRGNYGREWTYSSFLFQMSTRQKEKYTDSKWIWRVFCLPSYLSNDNIISA